MLSVVLLGSGNVAQHLFQAFKTTDSITVEQVFGRDSNGLEYFENDTEITTDFKKIKEADIYLIAVSDVAIKEVSGLLQNKEGIVAHTSGSTPLAVIEHARSAVFYPLQTFTKHKQLDFSDIPICLEAKQADDLIPLTKLAESISDSVHQISSEERAVLHRAAVFVNNFSNHLYHIGEEICNQKQVPFELLKPLIMETADKIRFLGPKEAQTGPARRNDIKTMQKQLDALENPLHKKIYQLMSESIRKSE